VLHAIFIAGCAAGFLYQTHYILSLYMQYNVGSVVQITAIVALDPPDMSVCIRYVDILSEGTVNRTGKSSAAIRKEIRAIQAKLTVKQIFDQTPSMESIVSGCIHKIPDSYSVHTHQNKSRCLSLFTGKRFYTQEYICYKFQLNVNRTQSITGKFKYDNVAESLAYPGMLYALLLDNQTLGDANIIKIAVHSRNSLPFDDLGYSQYFSRQVKNVVLYSEISVFYQKTTIILLPPPYVSACKDYHQFMGSKRNCISRCLTNATVTAFNKVPFSGIEQEPLDYKLISSYDTSKPNFDKELDKWENMCEKKCGGRQCKNKMHASWILKESKGQFENFVIRLYVPMGPILHVDYVPASSLQDLLVYMSSSISIWLGFSIMSLNPADLWKEFDQKRRARRGEACHCEHCNIEMRSLIRELNQLERRQKKLLVGYDYDTRNYPEF
jgi:hypothetical protein